MNIQFYIEKLQCFGEYKKFVKENPKAFPCSAFFVFDKSGKNDKQHFDFYNPEEKKIISFQLENRQLSPADSFDVVPEKIDFDVNFDFKDLEKAVEEKMKAEGIKNKIQKYLLSFQKKNGRDFLIGTVFISMLGMLKVCYDIKKKDLLEFEKKSFFDIMKVKKK